MANKKNIKTKKSVIANSNKNVVKKEKNITDEKLYQKDKGSFHKKVITFLVIVIIIILSLMYNVYKRSNMINNIINSQSDQNNPNEIQDIVSYLGKFMDLPTNETPTMATVTDKTKLQDQSFFKNAENGDKVIAYVNAKKAILYRPSTKKVIDVGPIYIQNNSTTAGSTNTNK